MPANPLTPKKRPFLFKLLSVILLLLAAYGWLRFGQSIYQWQYLLELQVSPGPVYTLISGLLIGTGLTIALAAFWLRRAWAKRYVQISVGMAAIYWWFDYLVFTRNQAAFSNWPFRLLASLVVLGFVYSYLYLYSSPKRKGNNEKSK